MPSTSSKADRFQKTSTPCWDMCRCFIANRRLCNQSCSVPSGLDQERGVFESARVDEKLGRLEYPNFHGGVLKHKRTTYASTYCHKRQPAGWQHHNWMSFHPSGNVGLTRMMQDPGCDCDRSGSCPYSQLQSACRK